MSFTATLEVDLGNNAEGFKRRTDLFFEKARIAALALEIEAPVARLTLFIRRPTFLLCMFNDIPQYRV